MENKVLYIHGINENTLNLLFNNNALEDADIKNGNYQKVMAYFFIDMCTMSKNKYEYYLKLSILNLQELKKNMYTHNYISFDKNEQEFIYKRNELIIRFKKLSDEWIKCKEMKKELHSVNRRHKCHEMAINMALSLKNVKIITGYINLFEEKFLHSVIEYKLDGELYIIDWTTNLRTSKESFVNLMAFEEITSYDSKDIQNDYHLGINELIKSDLPYLTFRDEISKDFSKNKFLFCQPVQKIRKSN